MQIRNAEELVGIYVGNTKARNWQAELELGSGKPLPWKEASFSYVKRPAYSSCATRYTSLGVHHSTNRRMSEGQLPIEEEKQSCTLGCIARG